MADTIDRLGARELRALVDRVHEAFAVHREEIDELNVFPVPDGDTGTNLVLTVRTVRDRVAESGDGDLPDALARGALMGARGNSGVIFSQVLRGFADTLRESGEVDLGGLVSSLERARAGAYDAVARPVEGTMLTAVRVAAERARELVDEVDGLSELTAAVRDAVHVAVEATTDQLEVLEEAGVVDAGARGFEVFVDALHRLVAGEPPDDGGMPAPVVPRHGRVAERERGSGEFRFEVQYLLAASPDAVGSLRDRLSKLGDSVVVVAAGDLVNVHVHTNDIGAAIEAGVDHGRPSRIEVTEFAEQRRAAVAASDGAPSLGVVAVLPGEGLVALAERHGVTAIEGRAGELPSVADLLAAVGTTPGDRVVILPGHPNVLPAARQAAKLAASEGGRAVVVVDGATSAPAVLAALSVGADSDAMAAAAAACTGGEVVPAARDATTPLGDVRAGQMLVTLAGDVVAVEDDPVDAVLSLIAASGGRDAEVITLVVGADVGDTERERVVDAVSSAFPVELDVIDGGQRPARYLVGTE